LDSVTSSSNTIALTHSPIIIKEEGRGKKEEGRRKREEGRGKKGEGRKTMVSAIKNFLSMKGAIK
jgi:hypothetical protein